MSVRRTDGQDDHDLATTPSDLRPWLSAEAPDASFDFDAVHRELDAQIAADRGVVAWLRARSTPTRFGLAASALVLLAAATLLGWARVDLGMYPSVRMASTLGLLTLLFVANGVLALYPLQWAQPPRWLRVAVPAAVPALLILLYSLPAPHDAHPASLQEDGALSLLAGALPCLLIGLGVVVAVAFLLRAFERRPSPAWLWSAAAGAVAANLVLQLHCPVTAPTHLIVGHLGVALLALLAASMAPGRSR